MSRIILGLLIVLASLILVLYPTRIVEVDSLVEPTVISSATPEEPIMQAPRDMETMIRWHAVTFGVDPDVAVMIARCESGLNEYAQNPNSTAKGLYQFTDSTWEYIKAPGHQFNAEENIHQFMIWYPIHKEWWECE